MSYLLVYLLTCVVACLSAAARGATTSSDQRCQSDFEEVAGPSTRHAVSHLTCGTNGRRSRSSYNCGGPHVDNVRYV